MNALSGVVPIIPIPFHDNEAIDDASLRRTVDFVASCKLGGMCLPAYGSEFYKLTEAEREQVVATAIEVNAGRVPVIAQANHGSAMVAAQWARRYEALGADVISFALPRQFAISNDDMLRYAGRIAESVSLPILIQDFNPGGTTIGGDFIATLHRQHSNFRYAKLEEPMIVDKLISIRDRVGHSVMIFEGWGGYYMLEGLAIDNCAGIMPGVPIADLLNQVYQMHRCGNLPRAYDLFAPLLPFINFTLQNFELFLQVEKRLLVKRQLFQQSACRAPTFTPSAAASEYIEFLIEQIIAVGQRTVGDGFVPALKNSEHQVIASR